MPQSVERCRHFHENGSGTVLLPVRLRTSAGQRLVCSEICSLKPGYRVPSQLQVCLLRRPTSKLQLLTLTAYQERHLLTLV